MRLGSRRAGKAVKRFALQVVELAYVRDRIDRGFGDKRVFALQNEEAYRVAVLRAEAGPMLQALYQSTLPPPPSPEPDEEEDNEDEEYGEIQ